MILVDSSVWIDYFNGKDTQEVNTLVRILGSELIITGDLIITEVLQGFGKDNDVETAEMLFNYMECFTLAGKDIAMKSAEYYRYLRKRGITLRKTIDVIIGTFCIENNVALMHSDKDFDPMENHLGLKIYR
jgi:predicted nucleic acid-binding protein